MISGINNTVSYENMIGMSLADIVQSEEIVIFVSSITDIRMVVKCLLYLGIPYRIVEMGMGSIQDRIGFKKLCKMTSWDLMPQIFINGDFVGGVDEFFEHPEIIPPGASNKLKFRGTMQ